MPRHTEPLFNGVLGEALRAKHPRWKDRIMVEQTGVFKEFPQRRPDIVVRHPGGLPVVIETEFSPANTVESDANKRLGLKLTHGGEIVEQAIALRIPSNIKENTKMGLETIRSTQFDLCVHSDSPNEVRRWPRKSWVKADVDSLASIIETIALSENRLAAGMKILEESVKETSAILREAGADAPDMLANIARELRQEDGEQTSRMAMAIITNALTFHKAIEGSHGIKPLWQLKNKNGGVAPSKIIDAWTYIYEKINYLPIFKTATLLLRPMQDATARKILKKLSDTASELVQLGVTSQHGLNGRMLQRLIADRKFLATFYTLPHSASLLAELAIERLNVNWASNDAVGGLRIADFACGTGALLGAAYSSAMSRYRKGGGMTRNYILR